MKNSPATTTSNRPRFWDILVVRQDGQWVGFRAPWVALRRTASYLSFVFLIMVLAVTGWLMSRWQVHRLSETLSYEQLKSESLEKQLKQAKTSQESGPANAYSILSANLTIFPSLDTEEIATGSHELKNLAVEFDLPNHEFLVKFDIRRLLTVDPGQSYYWIALLHGPQGILSFPPAIASRRGESIVYSRGQLLDEFATQKTISAHFKVNHFVESSGVEPMYGTVLIYDSKGSLILKQRKELFIKQSGNNAEGARNGNI